MSRQAFEDARNSDKRDCLDRQGGTVGHLSMSYVFDIRSLFGDLTVEALERISRWDHPVRIACMSGSVGSGGKALPEAQKQAYDSDTAH